jgi:undecaprenyl-diphosphatase
MTLIQAIILGIVEGLTEFLPVSSTGHQTIVAGLMGLQIDDPSVTSFIAVIQVGAIAALVLYLRKDIGRLLAAWFRGLFNAAERSDPSYREAWLVIIGSLPIVIVGVLGRDLIKGPLRSLWVVAIALIAWGFVMLVAEAMAKQNRHET